jgi:uncharacterized protein YndB with AHSA1/START domain
MNVSNGIYLEHFYPQAPASVWRALTTPELHARWWAPGNVRAVVGHKFDLDMGQWGKQPCEVLEVEPERLFKYRFAIGTLDTVVTWKLAAEGSGTRLWFSQEGFNLETPAGRMAIEGMGKGWPGILGRLEGVSAEA